MAVEIQTNGDSGGNSSLGFLLGAVLVAVAVVGFSMWDDSKSHQGAPSAPAPVHVTVKGK
ncbi:MAG TPA: hypothetical protein VGI89_04625 [Rhizomicrobium sp.]